MMEQHTLGYDKIINYSVKDLTVLYQAEGVPAPEAKERAKIICKEIASLNKNEQNLWQRVRSTEQQFSETNLRQCGYIS